MKGSVKMRERNVEIEDVDSDIEEEVGAEIQDGPEPEDKNKELKPSSLTNAISAMYRFATRPSFLLAGASVPAAGILRSFIPSIPRISPVRIALSTFLAAEVMTQIGKQKINRGYTSLFEYLVDQDFSFARKLDEKFYPDENSRLRYTSRVPYRRRWNPQPYRGERLLGGFQPIADMNKDFVDTFKPYKSFYYVGRDALQPFRGLGNIARGVGSLVGAILLFIGKTIQYTLQKGSWNRFAVNMLENFFRTVSWLLDGVSSLVRGATQVVTTPLTWFARIPLRLIITAIKGKPTIEENDGIQRLVDGGKNAIKDDKTMEGAVARLHAICNELHRKHEKALKRGQKTIFLKEEEDGFFRVLRFSKYDKDCYNLFSEEESTAVSNYVKLFSTNEKEDRTVMKPGRSKE